MLQIGDIFYLKKQCHNGYDYLPIDSPVALAVWNTSVALVRDAKNSTSPTFPIKWSELGKEPKRKGHPLTDLFKDKILEEKIVEKVVKKVEKKIASIPKEVKEPVWYVPYETNRKNNSGITYTWTTI